jgi:hypothetical protein
VSDNALVLAVSGLQRGGQVDWLQVVGALPRDLAVSRSLPSSRLPVEDPPPRVPRTPRDNLTRQAGAALRAVENGVGAPTVSQGVDDCHVCPAPDPLWAFAAASPMTPKRLGGC